MSAYSDMSERLQRHFDTSGSEGYGSECTHEDDYEEEEDTQTQEDRYYWPFHSIGPATQVLVPNGEIYQEMSKLLGKVGHTEGLYSFGDTASVLPGLPGLRIKDVGDVSLPLRKENAGQLEAVGSLVRDKLWIIHPSQVEMKNPDWFKGIQTLSKRSADLMGFSDVTLLPMLTMLLLYGPGGRLYKQPAVDPTGRSVATLLVQFPSVYSGGRLVVNGENGLDEFRYDLGKQGGTAEFEPQFAVYATGALRTVEEVTSGYRLVAVYSLCLPLELPAFSGRSASYLLQIQLSEAIKKMVALHDALKKEVSGQSSREESDILAVMLSEFCTKEKIEEKGFESLTGADRDLVQTFFVANALLPSEKQLKFYLACLRFQCVACWGGKNVQETISWYSLNGSKLGETPDSSVEWTNKFNFLNPTNETLGKL